MSDVWPLELLLANRAAFIKIISRYYPLERAQIDAYAGVLDFGALSGNRFAEWSDELIAAHGRLWDWYVLGCNPGLPWSVALIEKHVPQRWTWDNLRRQPAIYGDAAMLALAFPNWDEYDFALDARWTEETHAVIEAAADRVDWKQLSAAHQFPWSGDFIERNADRLDWRELSWNRGLPWSLELVRRFEERWDWGHLFYRMPWTVELLDAYVDRWDWRVISSGITWTEALIDRYADRLWWAREELQDGELERFRGVINDDRVVWTKALFERHRDRLTQFFRDTDFPGVGQVDEPERWTELCETGNWSAELFDLVPSGAISWDAVCRNAKTPWTEAFVERHRDELSEHAWYLASNDHFPLALAEKIGARQVPEDPFWPRFSKARILALDHAWVEAHADRIPWEQLSKDPALTEAAIAAFADRWSWSLLGGNPALTEPIALRFAGRVNDWAMARLQPWADPRTASLALPWSWEHLCARAPEAVGEVLDDAVVEEFLRTLAPIRTRPTPPPPQAPDLPTPNTPDRMASRLDELLMKHRFRELVDYGTAVLAHFAEREDVPTTALNNALLKTGIGCAHLGRADGIPMLERYIARTKDSFQHINIARILLALGKHEQALAQLDLSPADAFFGLGIRSDVLLAMGRIDDAEAAVRAGIASYAHDAGNRVRLGEIMRRRGRLDEARAIFRDVTERSYQPELGAHRLAVLEIAEGRYEEALPFFALAKIAREQLDSDEELRPVRDDPRFRQRVRAASE